MYSYISDIIHVVPEMVEQSWILLLKMENRKSRVKIVTIVVTKFNWIIRKPFIVSVAVMLKCMALVIIPTPVKLSEMPYTTSTPNNPPIEESLCYVTVMVLLVTF